MGPPLQLGGRGDALRQRRHLPLRAPLAGEGDRTRDSRARSRPASTRSSSGDLIKLYLAGMLLPGRLEARQARPRLRLQVSGRLSGYASETQPRRKSWPASPSRSTSRCPSARRTTSGRSSRSSRSSWRASSPSSRSTTRICTGSPRSAASSDEWDGRDHRAAPRRAHRLAERSNGPLATPASSRSTASTSDATRDHRPDGLRARGLMEKLGSALGRGQPARAGRPRALQGAHRSPRRRDRRVARRDRATASGSADAPVEAPSGIGVENGRERPRPLPSSLSRPVRLRRR